MPLPVHKKIRCVETPMPIDIIIEKLQQFYSEYGKDRDIQYTFGFFDAMSVLRIMQEETAHE